MALVEGPGFSQLCKAARQRSAMLTLPEWRLLASSLCDALTHAHELRAVTGEPLKIIHRDVSPGNLLVSRQGQVLLTDFGIARAENNLYRTQTGVATRGKYPYMAPEQLSSSRKIDPRADLFSAAVTLYETLTLVSPFKRGTDAEDGRGPDGAPAGSAQIPQRSPGGSGRRVQSCQLARPGWAVSHRSRVEGGAGHRRGRLDGCVGGAG